MKRIERGARVYDKADRRHHGIVRNLCLLSSGKMIATIRWEETGWISVAVPVEDLRLAARQPSKGEAFIVKQAIAAKGIR